MKVFAAVGEDKRSIAVVRVSSDGAVALFRSFVQNGEDLPVGPMSVYATVSQDILRRAMPLKGNVNPQLAAAYGVAIQEMTARKPTLAEFNATRRAYGV